MKKRKLCNSHFDFKTIFIYNYLDENNLKMNYF